MSTKISTEVFRTLPHAEVEGSEDNSFWVDRYNALSVVSRVPTNHLLADEGSYFVFPNPTIGTGVAHALVTAYSATSGLFVIRNSWSPADPQAKDIYLDYLKLMLTAAPTAGVSLEFAVVVDQKDRTPTANSVVLSGYNVNSRDGRLPKAEVTAFSAGALTVPAAGLLGAQVRVMSRVKIPTGINVVGDTYELQFGGVDRQVASPPLTAIRAAQPAAFIAKCAPVMIAPQQWCVIHRWSLTEATTAPSYEYELGLFER